MKLQGASKFLTSVLEFTDLHVYEKNAVPPAIIHTS